MSNVRNSTYLQFSEAAWECLDENDVNVDDDLALVRRKGPEYRTAFLAWCMDGSDETREQGWRDYVDVLFTAAASGL